MAGVEKDESGSIKKLIELGANMLGAGGGAAVGSVLGGPTGAIAGAMYGPFLANTIYQVGNEISERHLSRREEERIGATIYLTVEKIQQNIDNGEQIRQDWFDERAGERAAAEEIFEGTLLAAQREHEEKKLRYYGNLLANIAFHPEIDKAEANFLIRLAESISHRQMCLMAVFARKNEFALRRTDFDYGQERKVIGQKDTALMMLLQEIDDLISKGVLNSFSTMIGHKLLTVNPAKTDVQGLGSILYDLMELSQIDIRELREIVTMLR